MWRKGRREETLRGWESRHAALLSPEGTAAPPRPRRRAPAPSLPRARSVLASGPRLVSLIALAGLLATAGYLGLSDRYVVYGAVVMGNTRISGDVIRAAATVDGQRLFRVDPEAAEARVAALPEILTATVEARLPHDVWIRVTETRPTLAWMSAAGVAPGMPVAPLVIDELGLAVSGADPAGLPMVVDEAGLVTRPGDHLPPDLLASALTYLEAFPSLLYRAEEGFVAESNGSWDIILGTDASRAPQQVELLAALTNHLAPIDGSVYLMDLRYERPYYRLHGFGSGRE